jgi:hypothetical protein
MILSFLFMEQPNEVEVFRTSVQHIDQASELLIILANRFPEWRSNFDLEDCDRILRVQGSQIFPDAISRIIRLEGYQCQQLD